MSFFSDRLFKFIVGGLVFLLFLITIHNVYTQPPPPPPPTYSITAHGNSTTGVNRQAVTGSPYPDASPYAVGHCGHCHEMHASVAGAEPTPPTAEGASQYDLFRSNYGANRNELCYACHQTFNFGAGLGYGRYGIYQGKTKYNASIHYSSGNMVWRPDPVPPGPPYNDAGNCHNCHNPHGYRDTTGVIPSMLFARDSKTGDSPNYEMGCEACHDGSQGGASKNIKAQLNKTYRHPTHTYNNRHTLPEVGQPGGTSFGPTNRHAECVDCHNPHGLGSTGAVHTPPGNAVSAVLKNVWGVEPTWPSIWTQPTTFTVRKPPTYPDGSLYEYQICFKCHSYYGLGTVTNAVSSIIGPSGTNITDQAWEFNVNNRSVHPVVVRLLDQTGSYAPKPLTAAQMSGVWRTGTGSTLQGNKTMYCSDCHGADDEATGADGPHGSNVKYMLKGTGKYWPTKPDGTLWELKETDASNTALFCKNCHPIYDGAWKNAVHGKGAHIGKGYKCVACHIAVPHGGRRSRLIGYVTDPSPYNYSGAGTYDKLVLRGFKKAATPGGYDSKVYCYSTVGDCSTHENAGGYDP